jgi:hypothetical protein
MGQPGGLVLSLAVLLVLYSVAMSAMSQFMVENNSLRVISPDNLKGKYDSAIGNFGVPQYGGTLLGAVIYPK